MEQEDYLETIYNLDKELHYVRVSDVARSLGLSKPSVSQMMQRLSKAGLVVHEPYNPLRLTNEGRRIGKKISERHAVLADFLTLLGVPIKIQEKDIEGMEHYLSATTLAGMRKVNKFLKEKGFGKPKK